MKNHTINDRFLVQCISIQTFTKVIQTIVDLKLQKSKILNINSYIYGAAIYFKKGEYVGILVNPIDSVATQFSGMNFWKEGSVQIDYGLTSSDIISYKDFMEIVGKVVAKSDSLKNAVKDLRARYNVLKEKRAVLMAEVAPLEQEMFKIDEAVKRIEELI